MNVLLNLFLSSILASQSLAQDVITFDSETARDPSNLKSLTFVSRFTAPYGPDVLGGQLASDKPWRGYGLGVGAGEDVAYDTKNHFLYVSSERGFASIVDYIDPKNPKLTDFGLDFKSDSGDGNDIALCIDKGWVFVAVKSQGIVLQLTSVQRDSPQQPEIIQTIKVDSFPRQLLLSSDCSLLVISNENDDELTTGSVTLVRKLDTLDPEIKIIQLDAEGGWDDSYPLSKGLHMPLTKNALEYWDDYSHMADELDFSSVRENYRSSIFIQAETMTWANKEETELIVNLQVNNGLLRVDVVNDKAISLAGYGLKDHGEIPIDINSKDKACNGKTYANLFSMRNPDSIRVIQYNGKRYVLTANEGDNKDYFGFEDNIQAAEVFQVSSAKLRRDIPPDRSDILTIFVTFQGEAFTLKSMQVPKSVFDSLSSLGGTVTAPFNSNCTGIDCVGSVEISLGSSAIDYQLDPKNPTFQRMVLFGGRGFTIYELPENPDELLKLVHDSADDMERTSCEYLPWAYNSELSEDYAMADNMSNNTAFQFGDEDFQQELRENNDPLIHGCYDQGDGTPGACPMKELMDSTSEGRGPTVEAIVTGVACGRLVTVFATGLSSIAWLYDITEIANPRFLKIFHLSEASKDSSPGLAYNRGELGEVDPENMIFLSAQESPSGKAAVVFAGSHSGSFSFWEFECGEFDDVKESQQKTFATSAAPVCLVGLWSTFATTFAIILAIY